MSGNGSPRWMPAAKSPAELLLGADGTVLSCTRSALELLDTTAEEVCGRKFGGMFKDSDDWALFTSGSMGGHQRYGRTTLLRPGGGVLDTLVGVSPLMSRTPADNRLLVRLTPLQSADAPEPRPAVLPPAMADPRAQERMVLINEAASRIGASLDITRNAQELVDILVPALADLAAVDITEAVLVGDEPGDFSVDVPMRRVAVASAEGPWPDEIHSLGDTFRVTSITRGQLLKGPAGFLPDLTDVRAVLAGNEEMSRLTLPDAATSLLFAPVRARGLVLGAVGLWRTGERVPFGQADAVLAEEISSRAALSIDNARRYTKERRTAEALQRSLLPRPAVTSTAAETSGIYVPASTPAGIGGCWYDVIELSSTQVAFVVGTVPGHGLNATAAMGRLRSAVETLADLDPAPDELLSHLNDLVTRFGLGEKPGESGLPDDAGALRGASCVYATYDPVTRLCLVACAGHPAPILARTGQQTAEVVQVTRGPALGTGGEPFEVTTLELAPGDVLAFHSGSLTKDPRRAEERLETLRVGTRSAAADGQPLAAAGQRILSRLLERPPDHDIALLLTRTRELPATRTAAWQLAADPQEAARARSLVADQLGDWDLDDLVFASELIVSELVTNAIRYTGAPIGLRLIKDQRLICEVSDPSQTQPHLRRARLTDEGGRGLFLIAQLTHRWGSRYTASGKTIWTEQLLEGG
ncbi:ATP-binding SpoIIE family protein phosphatase [Streptomyces sp. NBC_00344]|uniref:ATP-binding SpoIIE family protein phosphatase n=1 Tax=Streptomyces sp. NBC_00344 TaxID=2975720 RepID=UPI002E22ED1D